MTGLDTNILARYFAQDDPAQSLRATQILEKELTPENPGYVSVVVMVELVWVLESSYGMPRHEVASVLERMLQADALHIQNEQEVFKAYLAQVSGTMSFADALLGELNMSAGCHITLTFDRKAARTAGFQLA